MEPPVSLSLLPRTMRGEADVVTLCQIAPQNSGGGFSPAYRTFVMEQGNGADAAVRSPKQKASRLRAAAAALGR